MAVGVGVGASSFKMVCVADDVPRTTVPSVGSKSVIVAITVSFCSTAVSPRTRIFAAGAADVLLILMGGWMQLLPIWAFGPINGW